MESENLENKSTEAIKSDLSSRIYPPSSYPSTSAKYMPTEVPIGITQQTGSNGPPSNLQQPLSLSTSKNSFQGSTAIQSSMTASTGGRVIGPSSGEGSILNRPASSIMAGQPYLRPSLYSAYNAAAGLELHEPDDFANISLLSLAADG